ncbi:hypothetical protein Nepgr_026062 [Nepenthes gracilis]|uniref:Renalase n=1 Tax=Nepenthes gracilis TaxID=150966 RepID=A0AAD3T7P4_NEPGR|nr:hypothetical protein Nepgr_026062 [Nepenthes gracilis]
MSAVVHKVAVVGSGISGAVCASSLARNGISVSLFESARGPGGRMSQRRESLEDGKELFFDHGAPYFTVTDPNVLSIVEEWESRGLVDEWKETFGTFDCISKEFVEIEKEESSKKYVGIPGMNSLCRALCHEPGVESKFGIGVGKVQWSADMNSWSLIGFNGQFLGNFDGLVASDKNIVSPRFADVMGQPTPLDMNLLPQLAGRLQEIPVRSCFALMLALVGPLLSIPVKGFSFTNSEVLSSAFCDSSKPERSDKSECWVLHSTEKYANKVISQFGLKKPSNATLTKVAEELLQEFQRTGLCTSQPYFMKAHRWGSAFPAASIAREEKCLWDRKKRVAICGDFCVSPTVEGAICSGMAASYKLLEILNCL